MASLQLINIHLPLPPNTRIKGVGHHILQEVFYNQYECQFENIYFTNKFILPWVSFNESHHRNPNNRMFWLCTADFVGFLWIQASFNSIKQQTFASHISLLLRDLSTCIFRIVCDFRLWLLMYIFIYNHLRLLWAYLCCKLNHHWTVGKLLPLGTWHVEGYTGSKLLRTFQRMPLATSVNCKVVRIPYVLLVSAS